jgi:hypothetical protein
VSNTSDVLPYLETSQFPRLAPGRPPPRSHSLGRSGSHGADRRSVLGSAGAHATSTRDRVQRHVRPAVLADVPYWYKRFCRVLWPSSVPSSRRRARARLSSHPIALGPRPRIGSGACNGPSRIQCARRTSSLRRDHPENHASEHLLRRIGFQYTHRELYQPTGLEHPSYLLRPSDYIPEGSA